MTLNCPACGASVPHHIQYAKFIVCAYCRMALFLEDEGVRQAGKMSVLPERPSLFTLGRRFSLEKSSFVPIGRLCCQYSRGEWDEWWVLRDDGGTCWMSLDDGDLALETPLTGNTVLPAFDSLVIGQELEIADTRAVVTEKDHCRLAGAEGELPFQVREGETHDYVDLSGPEGTLLSIEYYPDGIEAFRGRWIDPFDIKTG